MLHEQSVRSDGPTVPRVRPVHSVVRVVVWIYVERRERFGRSAAVVRRRLRNQFNGRNLHKPRVRPTSPNPLVFVVSVPLHHLARSVLPISAYGRVRVRAKGQSHVPGGGARELLRLGSIERQQNGVLRSGSLCTVVRGAAVSRRVYGLRYRGVGILLLSVDP